MNILVLQGPNLNLLGEREPEIYGDLSLAKLHKDIEAFGKTLGMHCRFLQSNHEGELIDALHDHRRKSDAIVFNPAGYTHTSVALRDAVASIDTPVIEVHLSNTEEREDFRKFSYLADVVNARFYGQGPTSYYRALTHLHQLANQSTIPDSLVVDASSKVSGRLALPGDKSLSHRALMFSSLADGDSWIENLATGDDVMSTRAAFHSMGVNIRLENDRVRVLGRGLRSLRSPKRTLDCGNSGTTMRLLSGIIAGAGLHCVLDGDESLRARPMKRVLGPLRDAGAKASGDESGDKELAPLHFSPGALKAHHHDVLSASAQVKSALLLAGLFAEGQTSLTMPTGSRDHTERMLAFQGIDMEVSHDAEREHISLTPGPLLPLGNVRIPGDPSTGAFFAALAAASPGGNVVLEKLLINPTRIGFFDILKRMGARVTMENEEEVFGERYADVHVEHRSLNAITLEKEEVPKAIDELPLLAILCTKAKGTSVLRHAKELRIKESDRIHEVSKGLVAMGAKVQEHDDGWTIGGEQQLHRADIDPAHDHRIAMGFAIAGAFSAGVTIHNAPCVAVSHPRFFEDLKKLTGAS